MSEWIDRTILRIVVIGSIIGTSAASIRSIAEKESPKAFVLRTFAGFLIGGTIAYILKDTQMPSLIYGIILFASGYSSAEVGALISKIGKRGISDRTDKENQNDTESDSKP